MTSARLGLRRVTREPELLRTAEGRASVLHQVDAARRQVDAAEHRIKHSLPLSALRVVPGLSTQRAGALRIVADSRTGAEAGRQLLSDVDRLAAGNSVTGGAIPLAKLAELQASVAQAGNRLHSAIGSSAGLWGSLRAARKQFDADARQASDRLLGAADGLQAARTFLGGDAPKTYFVAIQNNAEIRDQGMVLSYAVVHADDGRLTLVKNGPITDLRLAAAAPVPVPSGTSAVFGSISPTRLWQSVNATADFAWSGAAMRAMYRQQTGQDVDGVIAIDVPGLAAVLSVVGPVPVAGLSEPLTAADASRELLHDLYQYPPGEKAGSVREDRVTTAATKAVVDQLTNGSFDGIALGQELGDAAAGGHLKLWSRFPAEETSFEHSGLGGGPAVVDADRTFHVAIESRAPTKLDYYVRPHIDQHVTLTSDGDAVVQTTITVENTAPMGAPASEQLGPGNNATARPGDYIAWVLLWGPAGSAQDASVGESGLQLTQTVLYVPAGKSQQAATVNTVIHGAVRDGKLDLRLVPQPRVTPMDVTVSLSAPGWNVLGAPTRHVTWARIQHITWSVTR